MLDLNSFLGELNINTEYIIDDFIYANTEIKDLSPIKVVGNIKPNSLNELVLNITAQGQMTLEDTITLKPIKHSFTFEIDEIISENNDEMINNYQKNENLLDIIGVLWQNIVLEIPMRITNDKTSTASLKGEGWELVTKPKKEIDPRLAPLRELLEKKEEE